MVIGKEVLVHDVVNR